jgi:hypothetical protein
LIISVGAELVFQPRNAIEINWTLLGSKPTFRHAHSGKIPAKFSLAPGKTPQSTSKSPSVLIIAGS